MSAFTAEWLRLRESADRRARNRDVANALSAWFALRAHISVIDFGCGTGANLRNTAPLLPGRQTWLLIDKDAALLDQARSTLAGWADESREDGDTLVLKKDGTEITATFAAQDLAKESAELSARPCDLVTASALFDLVSVGFIKAFARSAARRHAALYATLTYNGAQRWAPHRPTDNQVIAAFNRHQMTDKGFGPAAGPMAASALADQLRLEGFNVLEGDSPWRLDKDDRMLVEEIQRGTAMAVLELNPNDAKLVESWVKTVRTGLEIGHTDIFAVPASASGQFDPPGP